MLAILIRSSDAWHVALQQRPDTTHDFAPNPGEEVVYWDRTVEEYQMKARNLVRGDPASVTGRTWEEMKSYPPGPARLDGDIPALLVLLKFWKSQGKRLSDPVTYGDLLSIAKLIRDRRIGLEDDGSV